MVGRWFRSFSGPFAYLGELFAVSFGRVSIYRSHGIKVEILVHCLWNYHFAPARLGSPERPGPPIFRCYAAMLVSGRSNDFDTISPISELQLFLPSSWLILLRMTPFVKGKLDPLGVFPPSVWREKSYDSCANNRWISESVNCPIPPSNWHESGYQKEDQAFQVLCCSSWGGSIPFLLRSWHCLMIILKKSKHLC